MKGWIGFRIGAVTLILSGLLSLSASSSESPRDVLERFCELDAQGGQLTPEGRNEISKLFLTRARPNRDNAIVIKDFVVSRPALKDKKAEFYVEYIQLGRLDVLHARFSPLPRVKVRAGFNLIAKKTAGEARGDKSDQHEHWLIEGAPPEPHLAVESALRYVTRLRKEAKDDVSKRTAARTLVALRNLVDPSGPKEK